MNLPSHSASRSSALPAIVTTVALAGLLLSALLICSNPAPLPTSAAAEWIDPATTPAAYGIVRWVNVPQLPRSLAILDSVFWEPADTNSMRQKIATDAIVRGARVLEIGTGSGLLSLCCLQAGAAHVIATDLNPAAVANARENAQQLGFAEKLEARLVPRRAPAAWTVLAPEETFDLILSNPPWENRTPVSVQEFALYDPGFELLHSLLSGARQRLRPGGRIWLAYGCVTAIRTIEQVAAEQQLNCRLLDERDLAALPELFLPGMLIEITVP